MSKVVYAPSFIPHLPSSVDSIPIVGFMIFPYLLSGNINKCYRILENTEGATNYRQLKETGNIGHKTQREDKQKQKTNKQANKQQLIKERENRNTEN